MFELWLLQCFLVRMVRTLILPCSATDMWFQALRDNGPTLSAVTDATELV